MPREKEVCDCKCINENEVIKAKNESLSEELFEKTYNFFNSISDQTRLKIVLYLKNRELCVGDLAVLLDMTKSSISHQLQLLKKNKIVSCRKEGKNVYYFLDDKHVKDIIDETVIHIIHR